MVKFKFVGLFDVDIDVVWLCEVYLHAYKVQIKKWTQIIY